MDITEGRRLRAVFPAGVWEADVEKRYPAASRVRIVAVESRRLFEAEGVPERELQGCEAEGPDGTRLAGCLKVYLPLGPGDPRERPFGMVFIDVGREKPALVLIAYGVRHPPTGARRPTVHQLADRRLHPPTGRS
jgi:hypothetical protein